MERHITRPILTPCTATAARPTALARRRALDAGRDLILFIVPFALLIAIWVGAIHFFHLSDEVIVGPRVVAEQTVHVFRTGMLPAYVSISLGRLGISIMLAIVVGVPIGIVLGAWEPVARMFMPFVRFMNSVSEIALIPLFLVWFGFSGKTVMVAIFYTAIMPVILSTIIGVRSIPLSLQAAVATLGGSRWRIIRDVYMPGAIGSIITGIRLGVGYGWRALIVAELIVGGTGLGFMLFYARRFHDLGVIILGMIVIGLIFLILDRLILRPLENATVRRWGMDRG